MNISRYSEMKDSGVEWIGMIPKDWNVRKLKWMCSKITDGSHFSPETVDEGFAYITATDVAGVGLNYQTAKKISPESFEDLQEIGCRPFAGDVLLVKDGATTGRVGLMIDNEPCVILSSVAILRPIASVISRYLMYMAMSDVLQFQIHKTMAGSAMPRTTLSKLVDYEVVYCSPSEQIAIVDYLDKKCAAIDKIIGQAKATIEEYKAWKASVIFESVTKGLDPNAEMKDSGVDWIGKIPKHWQKIKFKYLLKIKSGDAIRNETLTDNGLCPVYGGGELIGYTDNYNVEDNTILIGRVGARCGCITKIPEKAWATDNALIVKTKSNLDYVFYLLTAANLNKLNTSNAQPLITSTKICNHFTAFTSDNQEQSAIVDYLDKRCATIDTIIAEKQTLIDELETYKKSLIFETVTGKRRVC